MMRHPARPSRKAARVAPRRPAAAALTAVVAPLLALATWSPCAWAQSGFSTSPAPRPHTRPAGKPRWGETPPAEAGDQELSDYARETNTALHSLTQGNASIDVAFPAGGARGLEGSAGARFVLPSSMALSVALLAGIDKEADKNGFGGALKVQRFLGTSTRAFPYGFVGLGAGKNGGDGNKDADDLEAGASLGFGVEVFLLKEISTSAEVGIATRLMPGDAFRLATGTSQIALHYFFGE